jgi:hypothetical protein
MSITPMPSAVLERPPRKRIVDVVATNGEKLVSFSFDGADESEFKHEAHLGPFDDELAKAIDRVRTELFGHHRHTTVTISVSVRRL